MRLLLDFERLQANWQDEWQKHVLQQLTDTLASFDIKGYHVFLSDFYPHSSRMLRDYFSLEPDCLSVNQWCGYSDCNSSPQNERWVEQVNLQLKKSYIRHIKFDYYVTLLPSLSSSSKSLPFILCITADQQPMLSQGFYNCDVIKQDSIVICENKDQIQSGIKASHIFFFDDVVEKGLEPIIRSILPQSKEVECNMGMIDGLVHPSYLPSKEQLLKLSAIVANNQLASRKKQLVIDISHYKRVDTQTGIQRVVRSIIKELLHRPLENYHVRLIYAVPGTLGYYYAADLEEKILGIPFNCENTPIQLFPDDLFLGLDLAAELTLQQRPILDEYYNRGIKIYFVVYDLIPVLRPNVFMNALVAAFSRWIDLVARYSGVFCISAAVKDEYIQWHKHKGLQHLHHIDAFHLGADIHSSIPSKGLPDDSSRFLQTINARTTFLMVSTVEPRKGHKEVLSAFDVLWQEGKDVTLVIVGKKGWLVDELIKSIQTHPEYEKRLFWLNAVSDEFLEAIYKACTCYIAASIAEGFGLPIIEAAQHGLPVIARDIPVFREVAGDGAFYFNSENGTPLASQLEAWLALYELNQHPKSSEIQYITWQESAEQLKAAIMRAVSYSKNKPVRILESET